MQILFIMAERMTAIKAEEKRGCRMGILVRSFQNIYLYARTMRGDIR